MSGSRRRVDHEAAGERRRSSRRRCLAPDRSCAAACRTYASTAPRCSGVASVDTSGCSGASTMYVAPKIVSGRVVKTRIAPLVADEGKVDLRPLRAADPVPLLFQRGCRPVQVASILEQPLGIGGDAHHPLAHRAALDRVPFFRPLGHFFVGQHRPEPFAPVDGDLGNIRKAVGLQGNRASASGSCASIRRP